MKVLKRVVVTAAIAVAPLAAAQPADAGVSACASTWVSTVVIYPERFVDCSLNAVGTCTFFYDPAAHPVPSNVVPETVKFATCVA